MSGIDDLLQEPSLYSVRSDGSQMIVLKAGQKQTDPEWETLIVGKDGSVENNGIQILNTGEKTVLRKIYNTAELQNMAARHDFVEWQAGVFAAQPTEEIFVLKGRIELKEQELQDLIGQHEVTTKRLEEALQENKQRNELSASQLKKERSNVRITLEESEKRIATILERTPNETQKIIINQIDLSTEFYQRVGAQSQESFRLSLWLAAAGGVIFFLTVIAAVLMTIFGGNSFAITLIGAIAAALTEVLAASNRLYNQASKQFEKFQKDLDRINRSSISYAMISEDAFEKKTPEQKTAITQIIDKLHISQ